MTAGCRNTAIIAIAGTRNIVRPFHEIFALASRAPAGRGLIFRNRGACRREGGAATGREHHEPERLRAAALRVRDRERLHPQLYRESEQLRDWRAVFHWAVALGCESQRPEH